MNETKSSPKERISLAITGLLMLGITFVARDNPFSFLSAVIGVILLGASIGASIDAHSK